MIEFEDFIKKGDVKKKEANKILAEALKKSAEKNIRFIKKLDINDENAEHIVQDCYNVVRELIGAKLALDGYKSYSHEATILYLKKFKQITEPEIAFADNLRKLRNNIKYYGKESTAEEAKKAINLMNKMLNKLKEML
jgi:hypothetical protein